MPKYNYLEFTVENGALQIDATHQYQCRGDNTLSILKDLVSRAPRRFEGRRCVVHFGDVPPSGFPAHAGLSFSTTCWIGRDNVHLPFPCPYSIRWPEVGVEDGIELLRNLLEDSSPPEDGRLFWVGSNNHFSRSQLVKLATTVPELISASMMEWISSGEIQQKVYSGNYVSLPEHRRYKYLIDCPGTGYSARLRWLLATGRPVFIVERGAVEWWHLGMKPWVHYIPVREDLGDLICNLRRLEWDPELYHLISSNARSFVTSNLLPGQEINALLKRYPRW